MELQRQTLRQVRIKRRKQEKERKDNEETKRKVKEIVRRKMTMDWRRREEDVKGKLLHQNDRKMDQRPEKEKKRKREKHRWTAFYSS